MAETAAPPRPAEVEPEAGYDQDFVLWTERQAALIRPGRLDLVDWQNIATEIESLGSGNRRQLGNRLDVLIRHLLKWQFQPDARSGIWRGSIRTQRGRILRLLKQSPSLRQHVMSEAADGYARATATAADETGLPCERFPTACPYSAEQLLDETFFPGPTEETR